ncbi:MAG: ATP-binding protein [Acidimicrobiia bacterium]
MLSSLRVLERFQFDPFGEVTGQGRLRGVQRMVIRFRLMWLVLITPVVLILQVVKSGLFPIGVPLLSCLIVSVFAALTFWVVEHSELEWLLHAVTAAGVLADMFVIFLNTADQANATDRGAYLGLVLVIIEAATFWKIPGGIAAAVLAATAAYLRFDPGSKANEFVAVFFRSSALIVIGIVVAVVVSSLERARGAAQRQVKSMQAVSRFGNELSGANVAEVAERVADVISEALEYERVFVAIIEGPAMAYVSRGADAPEAVAVNIRWDRVLEFVDRPITLRPNDRLIPPEMQLIIPQHGALIIAPIRVRDQRFGILSAATRDSGPALAVSMRMLNTVAVECAQFLEQDRLRRLASQTIEELRRVSIAKDDFLAVTSHELRTPITALRGFLRALEHRDLLSPEEYSDAVEAIHRQVRRVQRLVEHLLTASTIDAGRIVSVPELVNLPQVVSAVLAELQPITNHVDFVVEIPDELEQVQTDGTFLRRILVNLCSNAVTYSPDGGTVRLEIAPGRTDTGEDAFVLLVSDEGIGIAPADIPKLFGRFERLAADRGRGGSGLGLYIVKGLVESLRGSVEATSVLGRGTTIRVVLPREIEPEAAPDAPAEPPIGSSHYHP